MSDQPHRRRDHPRAETRPGENLVAGKGLGASPLPGYGDIAASVTELREIAAQLEQLAGRAS